MDTHDRYTDLFCLACGKKQPDLDPKLHPPSSVVWCDEECCKAWLAANPEEAKHWKSVADMTAYELAELKATLGISEAKA